MDAKKKTFVEALHSNFGNVTKACSSCGVSRFWYYDNIKEDEDFKNHCENIDEYILDTVENCLLEQIREGNSTSTIFYLKTKGSKRGYIEQSKIDHTTNGKDLNNTIPIINVQVNSSKIDFAGSESDVDA